MPKLFISHAADDAPIVEAFVGLLEAGVGVPFDQIFCSSLKGQSIQPGDDFVGSIRSSLDGATCVAALISEAYYASAFCMCELGGMWLQAKSFLPILVPQLDFSSLKAVLRGLQASKLEKAEDLDELRDEFVKRLSIKGHPTPRWNTKRDAFLQTLPKILKKCSSKGPVPRAKFDELEAKFKEYRDDYENLDERCTKQEQLIRELKELKEPKAVARVIAAHASVDAEFGEKLDAVRAALEPLPSYVREALYYRARNEDYDPGDQSSWRDVQRLVEDGLLINDDNSIVPNERHKNVKPAIGALDALKDWLDSASPDFFEWYESTMNGSQADITLRPFWREHLK